MLGSLKSYDSILNILNTILTGTTDKPKVSRPVQDEDDDVGRQQISQIRNQRVICLTSGEIGMRILFFKDQIRSGFLQSINRVFSPDVDTRMDDDDALDVLEEALDELDSAVN